MQRSKAMAARIRKRDGFGLMTGVVVLGVVLAAAACGLVTAYMLTKDSDSADNAQADVQNQPDAGMAFVDFGSVVANLSEGRATRYLQVDITLQVDSRDASKLTAIMEGGKKALFKNWVIGYLSDRKVTEVTGTTNMNRLRREIQDGFNAILAEVGDCQVKSVLFTEFNSQ